MASENTFRAMAITILANGLMAKSTEKASFFILEAISFSKESL